MSFGCLFLDIHSTIHHSNTSVHQIRHTCLTTSPVSRHLTWRFSFFLFSDFTFDFLRSWSDAMLWLCWDVKMGFKKRYLMVFEEQYKNARGCHWQCVGQGGSGSSWVFLGKLSPFTTTNSNVDLGCIFQALFVGMVCSCYSLWLTTTIIVVVGTHMGLGSLVPPKVQVKGQPAPLLICGPFWHTTSLVGQNAVNVRKSTPTHCMTFLPLRACRSMCTFLNPSITCIRNTTMFLLWTLTR